MNCLIVDDEETQRIMIRDFIGRTKSPQLEIIGEYDNPIDTLNFLKTTSVPIDIIFLDHHMENMTGLQLVEILKNQQILPQVILITGEKVLGTDAYDYELTDYIIKPVNYDRFYRAIVRAQNKISQNFVFSKNEASLYVKADNKIIQVKIKSIYYIEALSDYMILHTENKKYIIHSTMKNLEKKLPANEFMRIHRSYIVHLPKIEYIEDMTVYMNQKQMQIPIGASYKAEFLTRLNTL